MISLIAGKYKGKKLYHFSNMNVRPTKANIRKSVFQILEPFDGLEVLDLYAGVGTLGFEALSRGASQIVFVEKDPKAFAVLKKNIIDLNFTKGVKLVSEDIISYIENSNFTDKFDLIFLDPPYKDTKYLEIISLIKEKKIFNKYHKIIIHREQKSKEMLEKVINIELEKNYGRSRIIFGSF